jgi:thiol-disulfide isomerase/thioredoxin
MKPALFFKLAPALGILLFQNVSSATPGPPVARVARLTGRVRKPTHDTIAVSIPVGLFDPREHLTYARLNERGEFSLSVPVAVATKADLVYGDEVIDLYLDPGTDLSLRFRGNDLPGTAVFTANHLPGGFFTKLRNGGNLDDEQRHRQQMANANNYLAEFDEQFVANDGFQMLPDNIELYEKPFLSFIKYRLEEELNFLADRAAKQSFTADFYKYAKAEITYSNLNDRLTYQDLREQVVPTEGRLTLSPTYYDFVRDLTPLNDFSAGQSEHYQDYLLHFIAFAATQQQHQRTDTDFYPFCYNLAYKHLRGLPRLMTLGRILQESFRAAPVQQSQVLLAHYQQLDGRQLYGPTLAADFAQHQALAIGTAAPPLRLPTTAGDSLSLSDFQGKLVYLNFWKSTSGPCLYDLAHLQELQQQFANRDLVFISIDLDEEEANWRQQLAQKPLTGVQLRAAGGYQAAAALAYGVQAMPAYVLIGEDGSILNPRPKRPSSRAAATELTQAFGRAARYQSFALPPLPPAKPTRPTSAAGPTAGLRP